MARACKWAVWAFGLLYVAALALLLIGIFGLFGQEQDPLSAVFLVPLGLPWVLWVDGVPEISRPWLAILAPALNIAILAALCRLLARRAHIGSSR